MAKINILIILVILLSSCVDWIGYAYFDFVNNTDKPVYVLVDLDASDGRVSNDCKCNYASPYGSKPILTFDPHDTWQDEIRDSAHIYVIDASMIDLPVGILSEVIIEKIADENILSRITILHPVRKSGFSVLFPENKVVDD
ncbi:MAG: hypothetical protein IJS07_07265 [Bacteroidales bacterium]|nr:hypothetical protein [Bacteroidales bacterium]